MRRIVTGVDASGRSCVIEESELAFEPVNVGFLVAMAGSTSSVPPPSRPPGRGEAGEIQVPPGTVNWMSVDFARHAQGTYHHTDTPDFDMLLEGSLELVLDDGPHQLQPGDVVVLNGVDHIWTAVLDGCRRGVFAIGTPPLE